MTGGAPLDGCQWFFLGVRFAGTAQFAVLAKRAWRMPTFSLQVF